MKATGFFILIAGLCFTLFTGFNLITKEKVVDLGKIEITQDKNHRIAWSPILGVAVMVIGGVVILYGAKRK